MKIFLPPHPVRADHEKILAYVSDNFKTEKKLKEFFLNVGKICLKKNVETFFQNFFYKYFFLVLKLSETYAKKILLSALFENVRGR